MQPLHPARFQRSRSTSGSMSIRRVPTPNRRPGYTLVEMLVAVALVVLMMSMFAEIFGLAAGSISTQRGIAENDQAARTLTTVIRGDLDKRTFRILVPFFRREGSGNGVPPNPFSPRQGYFYISENDPNNDADDVLQFTVNARIIAKNKDETPYYGKASLLTPWAAYLGNPNQPDADDGQVEPDGTALSALAEVSYFLRHGILYRRVLLIREPLAVAGANPQPSSIAPADADLFDNPPPAGTGMYVIVDVGPDGQPGVAGTDDDGINGVDDIAELGWPGSDDLIDSASFWNDFDFSAYMRDEDTNANGTLDPGEDVNLNGVLDTSAAFHGVNSLDNRQGVGGPPVLGNPAYRFGHNHRTGQPREYVNGPGIPRFIGRFTQSETSHGNFNYPQSMSSVGNPMSAALTLDLNTGEVLAFANGPRRGEDILLTNVHSFNLEVWDDDLGQFVNIGHDIPNGDFTGDNGLSPSTSQALNTTYTASFTGTATAFDTWHPFAGVGSHPDPIIAFSGPHAPYRPMVYHIPNTVHEDAYPTNPAAPRMYSDYGPSYVFNVGDRVYQQVHRGFAFYWECTRSQSFNPDGSLNGAPGELWPIPPGPAFPNPEDVRLGQTVYPSSTQRERDLNGDGNFDIVVDVDTNMNGILDPGEDNDMDGNWDMVLEDRNGNGRRDDVVLEPRFNWTPLRAIRITIRFQHVGTGQMRQVTLVHSLL